MIPYREEKFEPGGGDEVVTEKIILSRTVYVFLQTKLYPSVLLRVLRETLKRLCFKYVRYGLFYFNIFPAVSKGVWTPNPSCGRVWYSLDHDPNLENLQSCSEMYLEFWRSRYSFIATPTRIRIRFPRRVIFIIYEFYAINFW
jgi:hypothetical protein